jgi:hypothetical protein
MRKLLPLITALSVITSLLWAQENYQCFFGNLHAHCGYSDGVSTPDTAFAYARDVAGIDVQALTDHNNGGMSGGVSYTISPENYLNLRLVADTMTVPGVFVALAGLEIGSEGSRGFGHLNVFETELSPYFNSQSELVNCYKWISDHNTPAQFNHPGAGDDNIFNNLHFYLDYMQSMDLMEVINSNYEYERFYIQALSNGWHIGPAANQDNHQHNWGNRVSNGNIPLTGIWADTLTKTAILEALQARRTTAVEVSPAMDRFRLSLRVDGNWQGSTVLRQQGEARFEVSAVSDTSAFRRLYLYQNGAVVDSLSPGVRVASWSFSRQLSAGSHYFFVKAVQNDDDRAWTSPVFLDVVSQTETMTKVTTWPTPIREQARIVYPPLEGATALSVRIFDLSGTLVWSDENAQPGQAVGWNVQDRAGKPVPNGIYVLMVEQRGPSQAVTYTGKTMVSR